MAKSTVICIDNIIFMRNCKDKEFDIAIVDPEYLNLDKNLLEYNNSGGKGRMVKNSASFEDFSGKPTEEYFYHLFRISTHQIIFGGNYFTDLLRENLVPFLYPNNNWFIWNKQIADANWSMYEMAWCSIDNNARSFRYSPMGNCATWHPTSKPLEVYRYIFENYVIGFKKKLKRRVSVIDTNLGSQTSRMAALIMDVDFTGLEISRKFFDLGNNDFEIFKNKGKLFLPEIEEDFCFF